MIFAIKQLFCITKLCCLIVSLLQKKSTFVCICLNFSLNDLTLQCAFLLTFAIISEMALPVSLLFIINFALYKLLFITNDLHL